VIKLSKVIYRDTNHCQVPDKTALRSQRYDSVF